MKKIIFLSIFFVLIFTFKVFAQDHSSNTVVTSVGNPSENIKGGSGGWPTTGIVTQGPLGTTDHAIYTPGAIDIANSPGTPIYATFDGTAYAYDCTNRGECNETYGRIGNYVKLIPDTNPGAIILFGHMMSVTITGETKVKVGDQIGLMGYTGYVLPAGPAGSHLHYEFRGLPMEPPNIPEPILPATCDGNCSPANVSAK